MFFVTQNVYSTGHFDFSLRLMICESTSLTIHNLEEEMDCDGQQFMKGKNQSSSICQ